MNVHKNARLTYHSRAQIVKRWEAGETPRSIASAAGVPPACGYKWLKRHKMEGAAGLLDRTSRPHRLRAQTPEGVEAQIEALRRERRPWLKDCGTDGSITRHGGTHLQA